tara:strand:- start:139 stop:318 length:180 start_codon:yes stop_codon:yes gene_type:complete
MKIGDTVIINRTWFPGSGWTHFAWERLGLVLGFDGDLVQIFWGEDFPCEEEYPDQLVVV